MAEPNNLDMMLADAAKGDYPAALVALDRLAHSDDEGERRLGELVKTIVAGTVKQEVMAYAQQKTGAELIEEWNEFANAYLEPEDAGEPVLFRCLVRSGRDLCNVLLAARENCYRAGRINEHREQLVVRC